MFSRVVTTAIILSFLTSGMSHGAASAADVDAAEISKRKEVIHTCLLNIYLAQKKRAQALSEYQVIIGLKPQDHALRFKYARYIANGGTPADILNAISQIRKCLEMDPSNPEYNGIMGGMYLKQKNPSEALKWLKKAVECGGADYVKPYEDTFKYMKDLKRIDEIKKKNAEYNKKQAEQKQQIEKRKQSGGGGDDDDDW
ncbi:MAG: hypothetical protein K2X93_02545 [Candidatus Obscuribacterales bacterium]|nr:hypothetical protein [Candidatus Obscuribacterales bacterium]